MRRALILATLSLLLLAITGITLAQENTTVPDRGLLTESTVQDTTPATTGEPPDTTVREFTAISDEESIRRNEPGVEIVTEDSTEPEADALEVAEEEAAEGKAEYSGKPKGVGKAKGTGGTPEGRGKAKGDEGEAEGSGGQQKAILCHKGKKSLAIPAPARNAHLRHGDILGACQSAGAKPGPSGEMLRPEVGQNDHGGEGNGQQKVILCHKGKKTLTVGAPAQAAHLRHGDTEGPCGQQ